MFDCFYYYNGAQIIFENRLTWPFTWLLSFVFGWFVDWLVSWLLLLLWLLFFFFVLPLQFSIKRNENKTFENQIQWLVSNQVLLLLLLLLLVQSLNYSTIVHHYLNLKFECLFMKMIIISMIMISVCYIGKKQNKTK